MKNVLWVLIVCSVLAVSCGGNSEPEPVSLPAPSLVSTSPADGVTGIDDSVLSVVFTFDQNIKCTTQAQQGITVDGGAWIDGINATIALGLGAGIFYRLKSLKH